MVGLEFNSYSLYKQNRYIFKGLFPNRIKAKGVPTKSIIRNNLLLAHNQKNENTKSNIEIV